MRRLVGRMCICSVCDRGEGIWRSLGVWDLADAQGLGRILSSAETSRTSAYHRWCFLISNSHRSHSTNIKETDQTQYDMLWWCQYSRLYR